MSCDANGACREDARAGIMVLASALRVGIARVSSAACKALTQQEMVLFLHLTVALKGT